MSRKRRVSFSQLGALWEILNKNRALATGYNKSTQDREYSKRMWQVVADALNSQSDGADKNWKGWCKYWNDYKSKLKFKVASARASLNRTGGGPSNEGRLSDLELKFLQILGEDFGSGLPRVRIKPNSDNPTENLPDAASATLLSAHGLAQNVKSVVKLVITPKPRVAVSTPPPAPSLPPPSAPTLPPPSAPTLPPPSAPTLPPPSAPTLPPPSVPIPPPPSAPRTSCRSQQQRRRRILPMSAGIARRALVNISEERIKLDEKRNQILENLTLGLEEIRGILNTR